LALLFEPKPGMGTSKRGENQQPIRYDQKTCRGNPRSHTPHDLKDAPLRKKRGNRGGEKGQIRARRKEDSEQRSVGRPQLCGKVSFTEKGKRQRSLTTEKKRQPMLDELETIHKENPARSGQLKGNNSTRGKSAIQKERKRVRKRLALGLHLGLGGDEGRWERRGDSGRKGGGLVF